ncbi:hypothetical protein DRM94_14940 [Aeromonas taiwanensis]|uniref:Uncharacterized protein n=1 Tax=Aeromonas taiwanensis TaxID=633417 RepID=A0A5F0K933_9GAMM|nr:hypothetical protein DRM93_14940 [Aeromonas taiwanensis]TFF77441.1 hypothetical protein DRM94_14940 [Aeromonas taiwanensis]
MSGGTARQHQQAGEGEDTQEQGRAPNKRFATVYGAAVSLLKTYPFSYNCRPLHPVHETIITHP